MKKKFIVFTVMAALLVAIAIPALAATTTNNQALDWFKQRMEARKAYIDQEVQSGQLTAEQGQVWKDHFDQTLQFHEQNGFLGTGGGPGFCRGGQGFGRGFGGGPGVNGPRGGGFGPGWQANPSNQNAQ